MLAAGRASLGGCVCGNIPSGDRVVDLVPQRDDRAECRLGLCGTDLGVCVVRGRGHLLPGEAELGAEVGEVHDGLLAVMGGRIAYHYAHADLSHDYARLATPLGGPGSLSLWGDNPIAHRLIADHLVSEYRTRTSGRGREVDEWQQKPGRPDNHLFDCLVGAAVAASVAGAELAGAGVSQSSGSERRKVSIPEHMRRR